MKAPQDNGFVSVDVTHPCNPGSFSPPEWCTQGLEKHFQANNDYLVPDRTLRFKKTRVCGLDGVVVTAADQLLEETLMQPGLDYIHHPAMMSPYYGPVKRFSGTLGVIASRFSNNPYHWLFDILPRFEMLRVSGISLDRYYVFAETSYQNDSLNALGIAQESLLPAKLRIQWEPDTLIVPLIPGGLETVPPWVPPYLRDAFVKGQERSSNKKLYISRSKGRTRVVKNEVEVRNFLEKQGFETVWLEDYPFREQVRIMASAKVVVAAHGAGLAGMVFCEPGTPIIECFRAEYINTLYFRLARLCGHPYAAVVWDSLKGSSDSIGMDRRFVYEPIHVSIPDLQEALTAVDGRN